MIFLSDAIVCSLTIPMGRQKVVRSSFLSSSVRFFAMAAAHGRYGNPPLRLHPMLMNSCPTGMSAQPSGGQGRLCSTSQTPEKSGLPSAVLGVGASRFGVPAGVLGTPVVG